MRFLRKWLAFKWRIQRDPSRAPELIRSVFATQNGQELLYAWVDNVLMNPPRSTDPNESLVYGAQAAFIVDIIRALDQAEHPDKYKPVEIKQEGFNGMARGIDTGRFDG